MKKAEIETHRLGYGSRSVPAINVKVYNFSVSSEQVAAQFGCDDKTAAQALEYAFETAREQFWEAAQEWAAEIFGSGHKVYSEGRSGGWLYVDGLAPLDSWNAVDVAKWSKLDRYCREEIKYRTSAEQVLEDIEANEWAKPGAELFNFVETPKGTRTVADLKAEAIAAGFGPVIRKGS